MALFQSICFDHLHQKLGGVVCYERCGKQVMRSCPEKIRNPRSKVQQDNRRIFGACNQLAARFQSGLQLGFPSAGRPQSRNAFVSANCEIFTVGEDLEVKADYHRLHCSSGRQEKPEVRVETDDAGLTIRKFPQRISAYCSRLDRVYLWLWLPTVGDIRRVDLGVRGHVPEVQHIAFPDSWKGAEIYGYAFAVSANGHRASETLNVLAENKMNPKEEENLGK